jgi:hypothetical protein
VRYGESHPKKPCPATKTLRVAVRPSLSPSGPTATTHRNWLNHLADRYASLNPQATAYHAERNLRPGKIFFIDVAVLLREVVSGDLFYWLYDGAPPPVPPPPPGPDSMEDPLSAP